MIESPAVTTFLFTDIEGSSRLWEEQPDRMRPALANHDRIAREVVAGHRGIFVKTTGDGIHAAFGDPRDAIEAAVALQVALGERASAGELPLRVRCGMHAGVSDQSNGDYYGSAVNRAARVMSVAHGGQVLVSQTIADLVRNRLPEGVSLRDLGTVRLRDLSQAERLYQVEQPGLRRDFPALRTLESVPNNLAQQVTTFVGRGREQAEIKEALKNSRLVTLSGIGGLGKTRLSLQVAADVVSDFPDGVWFVELAPLADARLVPQAVASVLGVVEEAGRPVGEALLKHVRDRSLLLVLDNCEHLVHACADLAKQLLQAGAGVRILASSREHFNIAGEYVYTVPPLGVPGPQDKTSVEALLQFEAVHLFVERAKAAQPSFRLTAPNAPAVVEICRRLDGIPLALELAAARMRALTVEQIAARVGDRFRLLTTGDRAALPRQQTLRAMMDWSHDLLTGREQVLFRRLAVFAGGWTLEAAEAVASAPPLAREDVLDVLGELVDKSLVIVEAEGGRYRFLETVRQYAGELLHAVDGDLVRNRHLDYYLSVAEAAGSRLEGTDQAHWLAVIDDERENLLAAHAWCDRAPGGAELGLRLVHAIHSYWFIRGLMDLGLGVSLAALEREGARPATLERTRALFEAGQLCGFMGRYGEAKALLEEGLGIARALGDRYWIAKALQPLAMAVSGLGDIAGARCLVEEAVELAHALGDKRELATAVNGLAQLRRVEGNLDLAEPLYGQAIALMRELGHRENLAIGLLNLAMVWVERNAAASARGALAEAIAIALELDSKPVGLGALDVATGLAASQGRHETAARWHACAQSQMAQTGLQRDPTDQAFLAPLIDRSRAALGTDGFAAAARDGGALRYGEAIEEARKWLGPVTCTPAVNSASRDP